jgi:hypothetical protein
MAVVLLKGGFQFGNAGLEGCYLCRSGLYLAFVGRTSLGQALDLVGGVIHHYAIAILTAAVVRAGVIASQAFHDAGLTLTFSHDRIPSRLP